MVHAAVGIVDEVREYRVQLSVSVSVFSLFTFFLAKKNHLSHLRIRVLILRRMLRRFCCSSTFSGAEGEDVAEVAEVVVVGEASVEVPLASQLPLPLLSVGTGAAAMTSGVASSEYFLKFSLKSSASLLTSLVKSAEPVQLRAGFRSSSGTPGQDLGTGRLKTS